MTITPTYKMAALMWSKMVPPMWTQDGHHKMASRGGQLGGTRPARVGNWGQSSLQGRAVRGDQACREGQLEEIRLAGKQLGINQAGREWLGGDQAGRQKRLWSHQEGRQ